MDHKTSLRVNKSGFWEIRWSEPDPERPGKWRSKSASTGTKDRVAAERTRAGMILGTAQIAAAQAQAQARGPSVGDILDGYGLALADRGVGKTQRAIVAKLVAAFGTLAPGDLGALEFSRYRKARAGAGVTGATLRRELATLLAALRWGAGQRMMSADALPVLDLPPPGRPRETHLTAEQDAALFAFAAAVVANPGGWGPRSGLYVCIGLDTGHRKAAIEGLTWDRVDLVGKRVDFRDPALRVTKKRRVATPITDRLLPVLALARARAGVDAMPGLGRGVAVLGTHGDVREGVMGLFARAGLGPEITPHVLRHTRATLLLARGVSPWDVGQLIGASEAVVREVYGHPEADERLAELANRVAKVA